MTRGALSCGLLALLLVQPRVTRAEGEHTLTFTANSDATAAEQVVPMTFDKRLTVVMPGPIRMAVAGSPDVLVAHVKDNVAVVTLVDSRFVRKTRPVSNLTVIGADDLAFTCRVTVASDPAQAPDLVKIERGPALARRASAEAVEVLRTWLTAGPGALAPETAAELAMVEPLIEARALQRLGEWAVLGVEGLRDGPSRTKRDFIYLTARGAARVGPTAVLQATVTNHSQPAFTVAQVRLLAEPPIPADGLRWFMPDPRVVPDGEARGLGLVVPADAFARATALEICEAAAAARCVKLALR